MALDKKLHSTSSFSTGTGLSSDLGCGHEIWRVQHPFWKPAGRVPGSSWFNFSVTLAHNQLTGQPSASWDLSRFDFFEVISVHGVLVDLIYVQAQRTCPINILYSYDILYVFFHSVVRRCRGRSIPEGKTPMGKHLAKGEKKCVQMPHATSTEKCHMLQVQKAG